MKGKSRGILYIICLLVLGVIVLFCGTQGATAQESTSPTVVLFIRLDNEIINPVTAEYIINAIDHAEEINALCLVLELDTPGGLLESTRDIVKRILNARIPVICYVYPSGARAASAGVFITLASHIAAMAPSTNIGAAHPVSIGGSPMPSPPDEEKPPPPEQEKAEKKKEEQEKEKKEQEKPAPSSQDVMSEKIINDASAWIRAIAEYRGRNADWAEEAVRKSVSLTEKEALKKNVIDLIASSEEELIAKINGWEVKLPDKTIRINTTKTVLQHIRMSKRQRLLNILANPNIAYLLLILGFYGLLFEITHPGAMFPGIAGALCLILAAYALQMLPVNYAGLILIIMGLLMFVAEVKVTSYGLLTIGGLISLTLGSIMLIRAPQPFTGVSLTLILPVVIATGIIVVFLISLVVKSHKRRVLTGKEGMIGEIGSVIEDLQPYGKVFVHGEIWDAVADTPLKKGTSIQVINVEGFRLRVKPAYISKEQPETETTEQ